MDMYSCIVLKSCAMEKIISPVNLFPSKTNATMVRKRVTRSVTTIKARETPFMYDVRVIILTSFLKHERKLAFIQNTYVFLTF